MCARAQVLQLQAARLHLACNGARQGEVKGAHHVCAPSPPGATYAMIHLACGMLGQLGRAQLETVPAHWKQQDAHQMQEMETWW